MGVNPVFSLERNKWGLFDLRFEMRSQRFRHETGSKIYGLLRFENRIDRQHACFFFFWWRLFRWFYVVLFCIVFSFFFFFFFLIFFILNLVLIGLKFGGRTYVLMTCHNRTFVQLNWGVGVMLVILFLKYWMKKCIKINIILFKNWKYMFKIDY